MKARKKCEISACPIKGQYRHGHGTIIPYIVPFSCAVIFNTDTIGAKRKDKKETWIGPHSKTQTYLELCEWDISKGLSVKLFLSVPTDNSEDKERNDLILPLAVRLLRLPELSDPLLLIPDGRLPLSDESSSSPDGKTTMNIQYYWILIICCSATPPPSNIFSDLKVWLGSGIATATAVRSKDLGTTPIFIKNCHSIQQ